MRHAVRQALPGVQTPQCGSYEHHVRIVERRVRLIGAEFVLSIDFVDRF